MARSRSREQRAVAELDKERAWTMVKKPITVADLEGAQVGTIYSVTSASHLTLLVKLGADRWVGARAESLQGAVRAWLALGDAPPASAIRDDAKVHRQVSARVAVRVARVLANDL